jgi:hypothetical protein
METDTNNNTPLWEELKTPLGKSWKQIQITIPHCEKSWKHRLESHEWGIVICICFHDFPSGVFNSSHNGVLLFVSVSMTFKAVFSTLLTMGYCYLYLFPWLSQYSIVRRVENTAWKFIETDTNNNTPLWEELKKPLGKSWKQIQITLLHCEKSYSSHNGVLLFVSVSMTFQAVFSTLLTMGYCYLYLFPWLAKRCFQLFQQQLYRVHLT